MPVTVPAVVWSCGTAGPSPRHALPSGCLPFAQVREPSARVEHEASTSKIGEDQLFYFQQVSRLPVLGCRHALDTCQCTSSQCSQG